MLNSTDVVRDAAGMAVISRKKHYSSASQPPTCSREEVASLTFQRVYSQIHPIPTPVIQS